jgi:branched-subunit amino acid ABC-type transport system permease component
VRRRWSTVSYFTHAVGFGFVTSAVIALAAVGLALQVGVTNFVNFAYGDYMTFGAYVAYSADIVGAPFVVAALVGAGATGLLGVASNLAVFKQFIRRRARLVTLLIVTVGLSLAVQNVVIMVWGPGPKRYSLPAFSAMYLGPFVLTPVDLGIMSTAAVLLVALHLMLQYTKFGKALRATSNNPDLALACGINTWRLANWVWLISGCLAGLAGIGLTLELGVLQPTNGFNELFLIFAAIILGGIGRPYGAMLGALVIGLTTEVAGAYVASGYNTAISFAVLVAVLLMRPQGIFATRGKT